MVNEKIEKHKIVQVKELLNSRLTIPPYQRPYKWSTESAAILFNDIYNSYKQKIEQYRIGTVVLHKTFEGYDIVDGQQRLTTLSILSYCFYLFTNNKKDLSLLLDCKSFNELSSPSIINNFELLNKKFLSISSTERYGVINYVFERCTFVKIVTESEQEAFQFFDSQNSRGKDLDPHDLLKSFHLREMVDETNIEKIKLISSWENVDQKELAILFKLVLYPLVRYFKGESGLYYSSKKIGCFKGINPKNSYHFSTYHRAANLYIEHFNSEGLYELVSGEKINQFQLTQPIIAGKRFFQFVLYYFNLAQKIDSIIDDYSEKLKMPLLGSGNLYVLTLFKNVLLFFVDKFNFKALTQDRIFFFYQWAYSLRIVMHSVYPETVNKYALGQCERVNQGLNLFKKISEIQIPEEIDNIILDRVDEDCLKKYHTETSKDIWQCIFRGLINA